MLKESIKKYIDLFLKKKLDCSGIYLGQVKSISTSANMVDVVIIGGPFDSLFVPEVKLYGSPGISISNIVPGTEVLFTFANQSPQYPIIIATETGTQIPLETPVTSSSPVARVNDLLQAGTITALNTWTPGNSGVLTFNYTDGRTGITIPFCVCAINGDGKFTTITPGIAPVGGKITSGNANIQL